MSQSVIKRNGTKQIVSFDKITKRISMQCKELSNIVDPILVAQKTIESMQNLIHTEELDKISAQVAEMYKTTHPDYSVLASRLLVSNLHRSTPNKFSECMDVVWEKLQFLRPETYEFIKRHAQQLDEMIVNKNDYMFDYYALKKMEDSYLNRAEYPLMLDGKPVYVVDEKVDENSDEESEPTLVVKTVTRIIDRPQYIYMRVAIELHASESPKCLDDIREYYLALSQRYFIHGTPTLFNSCGKYPQLNSCFLLGTSDSIEEIMKTASDSSLIAKRAGGIGIWVHDIRPEGSIIRSTNGKSSGLVPQLKMLNCVALCWDQGGKRPGAIAVYLEPWHGDILAFTEMKLLTGVEERRARDLFYALWMPDLFYKRLVNGKKWSLFNSDKTPGLSCVYDGMDVCTKCGHCNNSDYAKLVAQHKKPEISTMLEGIIPKSLDVVCEHDYQPSDVFTKLYERYESLGMAVKRIKASTLAERIFASMRETGTPYVLWKDHVNRQTNQKNLGTIKSSNLCAEILEWSDFCSYACCTLASINARRYLINVDGVWKFDFKTLHAMVRLVCRSLDRVIDVNAYPVNECENNSARYRPIGIGIQALADTFAIMRIPFLSKEAEKLDLAITETIYHAALTESCCRARQLGAHENFAGSPASRGELRFDMWLKNQQRINKIKPNELTEIPFSGMYDWDKLKNEIKLHGLRNSLHLAFMPTATTSHLLGNNDSFEPFSGLIFNRVSQSGKFMITNKYMIDHLMELGLWNENMKNMIVNNRGSLKDLECIPEHLQQIYATVWDMPQKKLMLRAAMRNAFIDQGQSLNIYLQDNSDRFLRSVLLTGWEFGLCTGNYYVRTRSSVQAMKTTITSAETSTNPANSEPPKSPARKTNKFKRVVNAHQTGYSAFEDALQNGYSAFEDAEPCDGCSS